MKNGSVEDIICLLGHEVAVVIIRPQLWLRGCFPSRGMRQTFSYLSKLGGTTHLYGSSFITLSKYFLRVWWIFVNLTILDGFFVITRLKIVAANLRKMEKCVSMRS